MTKHLAPVIALLGLGACGGSGSGSGTAAEGTEETAAPDTSAESSAPESGSDPVGSSGSDGDEPQTDSTGLPSTEPEILFEAAPGAFFESVEVTATGDVLFTDLTGGVVRRMTPEGVVDELAVVDDYPVGIVADADGTVYFTAIHEPLFELPEPFLATNAIYAIDADGNAAIAAELPEAEFCNGMSVLEPGVLLITDSHAATIWRFETATSTLTAWLQHDLLAPIAGVAAPGANGIELHDGVAYVSNTATQQLLRVAIDGDGGAGEPELVFGGMLLDDFRFSATGAIYATTHGSDVVRIGDDGTLEPIANMMDGVLGNTAAAFGRTALDSDALYVVTDGGLFVGGGDPANSGPARVVRIPVGEPGAD